MARWVSFFGLLLLAATAAKAQDSEPMAVPADYRQWVFLTSSLDLDYRTTAEHSHHMLDNVFVDPASYQAFLKSGAWPDKTIMIKENRFAESTGTLSKAGQFQAGLRDLEIHIKNQA